MRRTLLLSTALLLGACGSDGSAPATEPGPADLSATIDTTTRAEPPALSPYVTYTNDRFGFSVDVPESFEPQPPPQNGDGRRFLSPDGTGEIAVFGANDATGEGLVGARERTEAAYAEVTYRTTVPDGFIVSGLRDGRIGYTKVVARDGAILTLDLAYPEADRKRYDDVVARASRSFPR